MHTKELTSHIHYAADWWKDSKIPRPHSTRTIGIILWMTDLVGFTALFGTALVGIEPARLVPSAVLAVSFCLALLVGLFLADTYHPDTEIKGIRAPYRIMLSNAVIFAFTNVVMLAFHLRHFFPDYILGRFILALCLFSLWAVAWRIIAAQWTLAQKEKSRWLVLVEDDAPEDFLNILFRLSPKGEVIVLSNRQHSDEQGSLDGTFTYRKDAMNTIESMAQQQWSAVIVSPGMSLGDRVKSTLMEVRLKGILIYTYDNFHEHFFQKIPPSCLKDTWFAFSSGFALIHNPVSLKFKRLFDLAASSLLCLITLPVFLLAALAIKLESRGPVFYHQYRTGLNSRRFRIYKLRTMYEDVDDGEVKLVSSGDARVTPVGKVLRVTRLNELPQLWNVFRGEMSLIGPRPEMPELEEKLRAEIPYYDMRYLVKPGISGWAQVQHKYCNGLDDVRVKIAYDLYYVKNYSFFLDLAITLKTIRVVLFGKGC